MNTSSYLLVSCSIKSNQQQPRLIRKRDDCTLDYWGCKFLKPDYVSKGTLYFKTELVGVAARPSAHWYCAIAVPCTLRYIYL